MMNFAAACEVEFPADAAQWNGYVCETTPSQVYLAMLSPTPALGGHRAKKAEVSTLRLVIEKSRSDESLIGRQIPAYNW